MPDAAPAPPPPVPSQVIDARKVLKTFLEANSLSSIAEVEAPEGKKSLAIHRPWGDASVLLLIPEKIEPFAAVLNSLVLPARYSAIWHTDTKDFEVLWTAFRPGKRTSEIPGRKFSFNFREKAYECEFGRSSERLLTLAAGFRPANQSETQYRNLPSFEVFVSKEPPELMERMDEPRSFWIRNLEWNEDYVLSLVNHLNFYLSYFDNDSPVVVIHSPPRTTAIKRPTRYTAGSFPKNIASKEVDQNLLYLWEAAGAGDPSQRFLYYYRVIEYSASVYLDNTARVALRIALALPNALDDLSAVTESVVAAVHRMKMDDYARYETMLREIVDPKLLWRELNLNLGAFTKDVQFGGGFKVPALLAEGRSEADFTQQDVVLFAKAIREIRNALFHGRDQKTGTTITPTTANFVLLQPWVGPIAIAASQVLLYKEVF